MSGKKDNVLGDLFDANFENDPEIQTEQETESNSSTPRGKDDKNKLRGEDLISKYGIKNVTRTIEMPVTNQKGVNVIKASASIKAEDKEDPTDMKFWEAATGEEIDSHNAGYYGRVSNIVYQLGLSNSNIIKFRPDLYSNQNENYSKLLDLLAKYDTLMFPESIDEEDLDYTVKDTYKPWIMFHNYLKLVAENINQPLLPSGLTYDFGTVTDTEEVREKKIAAFVKEKTTYNGKVMAVAIALSCTLFKAGYSKKMTPSTKQDGILKILKQLSTTTTNDTDVTFNRVAELYHYFFTHEKISVDPFFKKFTVKDTVYMRKGLTDDPHYGPGFELSGSNAEFWLRIGTTISLLSRSAERKKQKKSIFSFIISSIRKRRAIMGALLLSSLEEIHPYDAQNPTEFYELLPEVEQKLIEQGCAYGCQPVKIGKMTVLELLSADFDKFTEV